MNLTKAIHYGIDDPDLIAVTLTIKLPKGGKKSSISKALEKQHNAFVKYIRMMTNLYLDSFYRVYEFTQAGVLHVHGLCKPNKKTETKEAVILMNIYAKLLGFADIKPLKNFKNWVDYMSKDINSTKKLFKELELTMHVVHMYAPTLAQNESETPYFQTLECVSTTVLDPVEQSQSDSPKPFPSYTVNNVIYELK